MTAIDPGTGAFSADDADACYRLIAARRDVRTGFLPDEVSDDVLTRVLHDVATFDSAGVSGAKD